MQAPHPIALHLNQRIQERLSKILFISLATDNFFALAFIRKLIRCTWEVGMN